MTRVPVTLALSDYDHTRDLVDGRVPVEGVDLTCLSFPVEEIFHRFLSHREWDVSEMSFAKYTALASRPGCDLVALPVFPSRVFRQSSLYVRADSPLEEPRALRGRRVGLPEWAQSAAVYSRGWLVHQVGIPLREIHWVQAGVNQPGRAEKVALELPTGVTLERRPDTSLNDLLLRGEIDAAFSAHPPDGFDSGEIRTLLRDPEAVERAYYAETGIFPIMHVVAVRRGVHERHPWIAMNLFKSFCEALERSRLRALEFTASRFPLPWGPAYARRMEATFGGPPFVYGVEPNRRTLEAFTTYAHEQGITARKVAVEDLFAPETLRSFRI